MDAASDNTKGYRMSYQSAQTANPLSNMFGRKNRGKQRPSSKFTQPKNDLQNRAKFIDQHND